MVSVSFAGGSMTSPPTMIHRLAQIAVASIRYWMIGANGDFTAITEQAKPAIRNPNTAIRNHLTRCFRADINVRSTASSG